MYELKQLNYKNLKEFEYVDFILADKGYLKSHRLSKALVMVENKKVVSSLIYREFDKFVEIERLETLYDYRKLGCATKLLNSLFEIHKTNKDTVYHVVSTTSAISFYQKFDFTLTDVAENNFHMIK